MPAAIRDNLRFYGFIKFPNAFLYIFWFGAITDKSEPIFIISPDKLPIMQLLIAKEWKKIEKKLNRPLKEKEKENLESLFKQFSKMKVYKQINLITNEFINIYDHFYFNNHIYNFSEDILNLIPFNQNIFVYNYIGHGICEKESPGLFRKFSINFYKFFEFITY